MDKVLVEIYLPVANATYDVYLPLRLKVYEIRTLLSNMLGELSGGCFIWSDDTIICEKSTGKTLDVNLSVEELGLINGSKLVVI